MPRLPPSMNSMPKPRSYARPEAHPMAFAGERGVVEGYPDRASAMPGESVGLCCAGVGRFSVEVARRGEKVEVVWRRYDVEAEAPPVPADAALHGCGWPVIFQGPGG